VDFYNHHLNPSYAQLVHLYSVWRREHCGRDEVSMIDALRARAQELAVKGLISIFFCMVKWCLYDADFLHSFNVVRTIKTLSYYIYIINISAYVLNV
jgi:hypothetical protein